MNFGEFEYKVEKMLSELVLDMEKTNAEELGLDRRAGYDLRVCDDAIAVWIKDDSFLQYYGGFEYVASSCRREYGDWVIYSADDDRIEGCIKRYYENQKKVA